VATAVVTAALAFPTVAAAGSSSGGWSTAETGEEGAVVESLAPARWGSWGHWSRQRLEEAEPLPIITLPEPESSATEPEPPAPSEAVSAQSEGASTATLRFAAAAQASSVEGVEVAAAESTLFPNSANGKLFGTYKIESQTGPTVYQDYVCSGSVVDAPEINGVKSPNSNVVVTAGHCMIDPETGTRTNEELIFIPGYRNGTAPYGVWHAQYFTTTDSWRKTAKAGSTPNEGGDVAFVGLRDQEGKSLKAAVGSLGIGFDGTCNQVYTQFGYPAESPYSGELLYSHTAPYAGADTSGSFFPVPLKIASDFTRGASGGPWAVGIGSGAPTVLSLTAYGYANQPGYLFGPYFGEAAKKAYGAAFGEILPAGIEETCAPLPPPPVPPQPPATTPTTPAPTPTPQPEATPVQKPVKVKLTRVRRLASGSAVLTAKVNAAGMLRLTGSTVRAESLNTPAAGKYRLVVAPKGATNRKLRHVGRAKVGVRIAFVASGKTARVSKKIQLSRRSAARSARQHSPQSR
jgi:hypothetical protein